jgi:hypothetical protein
MQEVDIDLNASSIGHFASDWRRTCPSIDWGTWLAGIGGQDSEIYMIWHFHENFMQRASWGSQDTIWILLQTV